MHCIPSLRSCENFRITESSRPSRPMPTCEQPSSHSHMHSCLVRASIYPQLLYHREPSWLQHTVQGQNLDQLWKTSQEANEYVGALASWLKKTWSSWSFKGWWFYHNHPIPSFLTLSCMKWKHKRLDLHQAVVWPSDVLSHGDSGENPGMSIAFLFAEWSFATDCLNEFPEFIWDCMKSCMELGEWTHAH